MNPDILTYILFVLGFVFLIKGEEIATGSITAAHVELGRDGIRAVPIPEELRGKLIG